LFSGICLDSLKRAVLSEAVFRLINDFLRVARTDDQLDPRLTQIIRQNSDAV
jgi:hypothetical protein